MKLAVFVCLLVILPHQAEATAGPCVGENVDVSVDYGVGFTGDGKFGKPDAYVKLKIGKDVKRTATIHDKNIQAWKEKLFFNRVTSNELTIEIWDEDGGLRGDDDHLGTCMVQLKLGYHGVTCDIKNGKGRVLLMYWCGKKFV